MACLLAIGLLGVARVANATPAWQAVLKAGERAASNVIEIKRRGRGRPLYVPIVPYLAYDYPYYYRRGFYPQHIGPGYIYYGYPYYYRKRYSDRCSHQYWRCVAKRHKAGLGRQREACRCR
jgi:hypothetical protein